MILSTNSVFNIYIFVFHSVIAIDSHATLHFLTGSFGQACVTTYITPVTFQRLAQNHQTEIDNMGSKNLKI